jgi:Diadenosine tetraphosphate (Ap4A) hydrolase and other HIT family hydrolases
MSLAAEAVYNAFHPDKLNYELLGVGRGVHMHWHIFPRRTGDTPQPGPVWRLDKKELNSDEYRPGEEELENLKALLNKKLDALIRQDFF